MRYDLAWWNGARVALINMESVDDSFWRNVTLYSYVVLPACTQCAT
jgi:hypothetical protein